jgi:hypothetical protein
MAMVELDSLCPRDAGAFIEGARLSISQRDSIFHRNLERLFHLV